MKKIKSVTTTNEDDVAVLKAPKLKLPEIPDEIVDESYDLSDDHEYEDDDEDYDSSCWCG